MLNKYFFILCIIFCTHPSSCMIEDILAMGRMLWKSSLMFETAWGKEQTYQAGYDVFFENADADMDEIKEKIDQLSKNIDEIQKTLDKNYEMIERLLEELPDKILLNDMREEYQLLVPPINHMHSGLLEHVKNGYSNPKIMEDVAFSSMQIDIEMTKLRSLLAPLKAEGIGGPGLVEMISKQKSDDFCRESQTIQYSLYQLFKTVMMLEMKVLHILSASFRSKYSMNDEWQKVVAIKVKNFEDRYLIYVNTFVQSMKMAPGSLRACDPENGHWTLGKTYFKFEQFGYRFHGASTSSCKHHFHHKNCYQRDDCHQSTRLKTCKRNGRYLWIETEERRYGYRKNSPQCTIWESHSTNFWGMVGNFLTSKEEEVNCICRCTDNNGDTENFINLSFSRSNVAHNQVIIGARIVLQDKILHIQVKQGKLLGNGQIDPKLQSWVPLPTNPDKKRINFLFRTFVFNNPVLPVEYVLVGVRFRPLRSYAISLEVIGKKFNFVNGTLLPGFFQNSSTNASGYIPESYRRKSSIHGKHITHKRDPNIHSIRLESSELDDNVGQSTLPLLDGIPVEPDPPSPLGGIGFYYKSAKNYAGFISVQLQTLSYKDYLVDMLRNFKEGTLLDECNENTCTPDDILDIGEMVYSFMGKVVGMDKKFLEIHPRMVDDGYYIPVGGLDEKILQNDLQMVDKFNEIKNRLNDAEYNGGREDFSELIKNVIDQSLLADPSIVNEIEYIESRIFRIDGQYNTLNSSAKNWRNYEPMLRFYQFEHLETFFFSSQIMPESGGGFFNAIAKHNPIISQDQCEGSQTMQHMLTQIFRKTIISDMKDMINLVVSSKMSTSPEESALEIMKLQNNFKQRFINYVGNFSEAMDKGPGYIIGCDPKLDADAQDETNKQYIEMKALGSRVFFHYVQHGGEILNCDDALQEKKHEWSDKRDECFGNIAGCYPVETVHVCREEKQSVEINNPPNLWVKEGQRNLRFDDCPYREKVYATIENNLQQCICSCNSANNYISLALVMTNVEKNMVVTGVRFVHHNSTLHIQLKQGKLLSNGWIDPNSQNWIPIQEDPRKKIHIGATGNKFFLDDIIFQTTYAVVGVQFVVNNGTFIKVTAQKYNFPTGLLLSQKIVQVANHVNYQELFFARTNSIYQNLQHQPDSKNHWIELKSSIIFENNAEPILLPLFDNMTVATNPPTPISGIGIFHKGAKGYAGYISLRLHSLQFKKNLREFIERYERGQAFMNL